jgi:hypothetical protein
MPKLAIVIPAFKIMYFEQVLISIANQTCKDFTLYIGSDASPHEFKPLVDLYASEIRIVFKHFDENLGGKDLVAQWERCIDLVGDEEWIWLFSDDDFMDLRCVENFYRSMSRNPDYDLFHFNVMKVDEFNNATFTQFIPFPEILTSEEFLIRKLQGGYFSTAVEYIFRKSHFLEQGRFQNFDLAWGSDTATWIKLGQNRGIRNIDEALVYWRESPFNISTNNWDKEILIRKHCSRIEFANWIYLKAMKNEIQIPIIKLKGLLEKWVYRSIQDGVEFISYKTIGVLVTRLNSALDNKRIAKQKIGLLYFYKIFQFFKGLLKKIIF